MDATSGSPERTSWHHQDSLSAHLFSHPAPASSGELLETVALSSGHPSWLRALSLRDQLTDETWNTLWQQPPEKGGGELRPGLCSRPLTTHQFRQVTDPAFWPDQATPGDLGEGGAAQLMAAAIAANPNLLDPATLQQLTCPAGRRATTTATETVENDSSGHIAYGSSDAVSAMRAAVAASAIQGSLTVTTDTVALIDAAAAATGPQERVRVAATWADLYPLHVLAAAVHAAADAVTQRTASDATSVLTHVILARRDDLASLFRTDLATKSTPGRQAGVAPGGAEGTSWLAGCLAESDETRRLLHAPPMPSADAVQLGHGHLLSLAAEGHLPDGAWAYVCRRLHTPAQILRYGRRLTGSDRCHQNDCWAATRLPGSENCATPRATHLGTVGELRGHLARFEHTLLARTTSGTQTGSSSLASLATLELAHPQISRLLLAAAGRLQSRVAGWELLCWLIDTVEADTTLEDLVALADTL